MDYNCWMLVFTAMSGIGACAAVYASYRIYKRQEKIALFDRRMRILNDFETFIFSVLPDWEWKGDCSLVEKYARHEVVSLFDETYGQLQDKTLKVAMECNTLLGDIDHAKRRGECHGKADYQLEEEKIAKEKDLGESFKEMRGKAYERWLKI